MSRSYIVFWKGSQLVVPSSLVETLESRGLVSKSLATLKGELTGGVRYHATGDLTGMVGHCILVDPETVFRGRTSSLAVLLDEVEHEGQSINNGLRARWNKAKTQTRAGNLQSLVAALKGHGGSLLDKFILARRTYLESNYMTAVKRRVDSDTLEAGLVIRKALRGTREARYLNEALRQA